jgi:hypothetical protein
MSANKCGAPGETPAIGIGRGGAYWTDANDPNAVTPSAEAVDARADKIARESLAAILTDVFGRLKAKAATGTHYQTVASVRGNGETSC